MALADPSPAVARARTVPDLLDALQRSNPGRPRLTWYGPDGERIELSAKTLANWVAKTANLLVEEFDTGPDSTVRLALAPHWKTVVLDLAVRAVGGQLCDADEGGIDLLVTDAPGADDQPDADDVLVVALPALARSYAGSLASGIDYAAEVFTHDDLFVPSSASVLEPPGQQFATGARVVVRTDSAGALGQVLDVLRVDGSVVLALPTIGDDTLAGELLG